MAFCARAWLRRVPGQGLLPGFLLGLFAFQAPDVSRADGDDYFEPTEIALPFDFESRAPFSKYLAVTEDHLAAHRELIKPRHKASEIELVMPFEMTPPAGCLPPVRGVLLVHGILDTPYAMRDIAAALNGRCFLVRSILLPGHGTRAGDMLTVTADHWLAAVDYGVRSLHRDVNEVYVGGYSLGGLLAAHVALSDQDIRAALLFAPALGVSYPVLAHQSSWLRHLKEWLDRSPAPLPIRYQAMSTNAVAQVVELVKRYDDQARDGFSVPAFVVTTVDDIAVRSDKIIEEFVERFDHPLSRLEIYGEADLADDLRIRQTSSYFPEQRVLNIAHMGIPYRADDLYFGRKGLYRDCGQYLPIIPNDEVAACQRNSDNWRGEMGSTRNKKYLPIQRLTYNPLFEQTMQRMFDFLETVSDSNGDTP